MNGEGEETLDKRHVISGLCERHSRLIISKLKRDHKGSKSVGESLQSAQDNQAHLCELKLWRHLKKLELNDAYIVGYVQGFYSYLLQICTMILNDEKKDPYFIKSNIGSFDSGVDNVDELLLIYNINIRLGDLNRYMRNNNMAIHHYLQAREMNPLRGHSYNQLAFVSSNDHITTLYYLVRAANAIESPISNAIKLINSSVVRNSPKNQIIRALFTNEKIEFNYTLVKNWLQLIVIAIHSNMVNNIGHALINEVLRILQMNLTKTVDDQSRTEFYGKSWTFPALDILLDLIHERIGNERSRLLDLENEIQLLSNELNQFDLIHDTAKYENDQRAKALEHDFSLFGFAPLKEIHSKINFEVDVTSYTKSNDLLHRIENKMVSVLSLINEKKRKIKPKRTRNVVLESILNSQSNGC